jgi:uncharacterized protein YecE (DUF72 family)
MIRVGVGGWTFAPWRGPFYPKGLPQKDELSFAARQLTAIEINGTFYRTQSPASFAKWRDETPDGFVFALKGHRVVTNRKVLAEAGEAVATFVGSGVAELGAKLGPINWQLAGTKRFDAADVDAFLGLLPAEIAGLPLRHALEVRHPSFVTPEFVDIARRHGVAIVFADSDEYPAIADPVGDFVYARLQRSQEGGPEGYAPADLDRWAGHAKTWEAGGVPEGLPTLAATAPKKQTRDVFVFFISGDKVRNPAAAQALIARL